MLQRLPIALAQVKAGNTSENLLNEIRQIICSLYQKNIAKEYVIIQNMLLYQTLVFTIHGKTKQKIIKIITLRYQLQHGMKNLNYLMDHILYQIFKIILNIS